MSKGGYNPNPSPQWVKDALCEMDAEWQRELGIIPDSRRIEQKVLEDLRIDDAKDRYRKPRPQVITKDGPDPAKEAASELGLSFHRKQIANGRKRVEPLLNPWQRALRDRVRELSRFIPGTNPRDQQFLYPAFGKAFALEMTAYMARGTTHGGKYAHLTEREASRALSRFCEDMADRSTGILGPWRKGNV